MSEQRLRERLWSTYLPVSESGRFVGFGPDRRILGSGGSGLGLNWWDMLYELTAYAIRKSHSWTELQAAQHKLLLS